MVQKDAIQLTQKREIGPPYNAFLGKNAPCVNNLHPFSEIGICYVLRLGYNRTNNKGRIGLYINSPINHPQHTFKFYHPCAKKYLPQKRSMDRTYVGKV